MDEIIIDKLRVFCKHGVYADEQTNGQNFMFLPEFLWKHILQV